MTDLEILQKKYDILFDKVRRVRGWQKEYKKYHVEQDRQMMIRNERELDAIISNEVEQLKKKQKQLF